MLQYYLLWMVGNYSVETNFNTKSVVCFWLGNSVTTSLLEACDLGFSENPKPGWPLRRRALWNTQTHCQL